MEDITEFSREFYAALEARMGEEAAGKLQIEVSSPVRMRCWEAVPSTPLQCHACTTFHGTTREQPAHL